jgi:hypothetical protein
MRCRAEEPQPINISATGHSSTLKTLQEIFHVEPLLGAAADAVTKDLSDFFKSCDNQGSGE